MENAINLLKKFNSDAKKADPRKVPQPRHLQREREEVWLKAASAALGHLRAARAEYDLQSAKAAPFLTSAVTLMRELLNLGKRNFSVLERYRYAEDIATMLRKISAGGVSDRLLDDAKQLFEILSGRTPTRKPFSANGPKGWVEIKKTPAEGAPKDSASNSFSFVVSDSSYPRIREKLELLFGPYFDDRVKTEYVKNGSRGMQTVRVSAVKPDEEKKILDIIAG